MARALHSLYHPGSPCTAAAKQPRRSSSASPSKAEASSPSVGSAGKRRRPTDTTMAGASPDPTSPASASELMPGPCSPQAVRVRVAAASMYSQLTGQADLTCLPAFLLAYGR